MRPHTMRRRARTTALLSLILSLCTPAFSRSAYDDREEWYITTDDGCTLYATELGAGETVVVLHGGWGAEHSYMQDAFEGLEDRYHLIFYDQRGSLRSPCPEGFISFENHLKDLDRLRSELGLERMTLVAHSFGTHLAMSYLEAHPENVGRLVLLGAVPPKGPPDAAEMARAPAGWESPEVAPARSAAILRDPR